MLLTGHFRCWHCERTWTIADGLAPAPDGAHPVTPLTPPGTPVDGPDTTASPAADPTDETVTRLRQDGHTLLAHDGAPRARISVFDDRAPGTLGGVNALTVVAHPGRPALVAGAGDSGVVGLWDPADGRLLPDPLPVHPGRVCSMTAVPLPDGRVVLATGGHTGTIALWDPATGQPVREPAGNWLGEVTGMCAATVPDGRTLLVTATARGAVRLRDPSTGESVGRLNPSGRPIRSVAAVPISATHTLIAASDTQGGVQIWDPAVDDPWERGVAVQLSERALKDADHRVAAVAAVPAHDRAMLATADDRGAVMLWDLATGGPVGDGLPTDTGTAGPPVIAATALPGGHTVLAAGGKRRRDLRVWEPDTGAVRHIALDVALTCLATAGSDLIVGHDAGVLAFPLTGR
jgi:WD40 repeat protein